MRLNVYEMICRATRAVMSRQAVALMLAVHLCAAVAIPQGVRRRAAAGRPAVTLFAVTAGATAGDVFLEPIVSLERGRYVEPASGESDDKALTNFAARHYRRGQAHDLFFGGVQHGTVSITDNNARRECNRAGANGTARTDINLGGYRKALAASGNLPVNSESQRRAANNTERSQALALARDELRRRGVGEQSLDKISVVNLTAFDEKTAGTTLVGSFLVAASAASRATLFFIARSTAGKYNFELVQYEEFAADKIMSGDLNDVGRDGLLVEMLVDAINLDGDKTLEIVTSAMSFEGVHYKIYDRRAAQYRPVYSFYSYRCAY